MFKTITHTLSLVLLPIWAPTLSAHEFFIDPEEFSVAANKSIQAQFKVGSDFVGPKYSYIDFRTVRHQMIHNGQIVDVPARSGDRPAMQIPNPPEGLVTLVHETTDSSLTYKEAEKFEAFLKHKDALWALEYHKAQGWPEVDFGETYRRYAKSLIHVGHGKGKDARAGMRFEFLALENPRTDNLVDGFSVQVWLDDAPRANEQVELYERGPDGAVEVTLHQTDAQGIVNLPVKSGHTYMADSVALFVVDPKEGSNVLWHSVWANLTFQTPN